MSSPDKSPIYTIIVAHDPDLVIGDSAAQDLPWHYPEDLKHFKRTTMGQPLLMGRITFESIGGKPLPNRPCYILTSGKLEGVRCFSDHRQAMDYFYTSRYQRVFVAGGAGVYKTMLPHADEMIITEIKKRYEGDVRFPEYRHDIGTVWKETDRTEHPDFVIKTYIRDQGDEV